MKRSVLMTGENQRRDVALRMGTETRYYDLAVEPLWTGGEIAGVSVAAVDVTDRRAIMAELEAARQEAERIGMHFRSLANGIPQLAWMARPDGWIYWYNRRWYEFTGTTPEQMEGWGWQAVHHPQHLDAVVRRIRDCFERGEAWEDTFPMRSKTGEYRWFLSRALPVRNSSGEIALWFGTNTDITERLKDEEALKAAKEEAERAARAKSTFLAAASHDLRQPVQALVLFNAALQQRLRNHPAAPILARMKSSMEALQVLLEGILDVSRLDAGIVTANLQSFPLGEMVARLGAEYAIQARAKGLRLRYLPISAWVRSDPALLERILRNLLENAVRYTEQGGILLGCRMHGEMLRLQVVDTGVGISAAEREAVFEEFYQVGNRGRDRARGLGLGLAIVRRLAGLLGHRLEVSSVPGKGSVFGIELPRVAPVARPVSAAMPVDTRRELDQRSILVIDDEAMMRQGLEVMLSDWGCRVMTAATEEEAVLAARANPPDAIIADYRLQQGRTGTDAVRAVQRACGREIPAIVLTGDTAPERIVEVKNSGLVIAHKPVVPDSLLQLVAAQLS